MVVKGKGTGWVGTVGGGCMEGDVLEAAKSLYEQRLTRVLAFSLNENDMVQGLICGGSLEVLVEPLTRDHIPLIKEMMMLRDNGDDGVIATFLDKERSVLKRLFKSPGDTAGVVKQWTLILQQEPALQAWRRSVDELAGETGKAHHRHETRRIVIGEGEVILEPLQGRPHLMVFGGGHVSRSLSRTAAMSGFRVTVIDDRKEYAHADRFPEADATIVAEFYDAFNHLTVGPSTYIVIVTRGHRSDEEVLEQALRTPAKYIGMIGSRRKVLTTYQHLVDRGTDVDALRRLHAPVGLDIGAVTAEEIGVSVVAELISVRRHGVDPVVHMSHGMGGLLDGLVKKKPPA